MGWVSILVMTEGEFAEFPSGGQAYDVVGVSTSIQAKTGPLGRCSPNRQHIVIKKVF